jgi:GDP-L-fucose synthase
VTIADFAKLIAEIVGYKGKLVFDRLRPDGTPRKLLDSSKLIEKGWQPRTLLRRGWSRLIPGPCNIDSRAIPQSARV